MLDVGTENEELLESPLYLGVRSRRIDGTAYTELIDELVDAVQDAYPRALIQFEDFLTPNAYRLLARYRDRVLSFNDDIQGTAAVALAGVYASTRITGHAFRDLRFMFLGAGSAATGIGDLMTCAFQEEGLSQAEARRRLWFADRTGLVVAGRSDLDPHNLPYAHDHPRATFLEALEVIRPQVLIGATGHGGAFTEEVVRTMARLNDRPTLFALSNPTSKAECTAEQAYTWSDGRAIFASGSPFGPVRFGARVFRPGQGNNVYIFPGVGLGAVVANARRITDGMFLAAARALADAVEAERDLAVGALYPPLTDIRAVSRTVARVVAELAFEEGLAREPHPGDIDRAIADFMYDPRY
jgi:malate dehydrogenase (oxaloacetate-decarboxylating)(NADP+)